MRNLLAVAGSAAALGALLAARPAFANRANDTLNVEMDQEIENADSYYNTSREGIILAHQVWSYLINRNPETFAHEPGLATSWKWKDPLTLELTLRTGVQFQNGEPFSADDVVYTLNYVSNPKNKVLNQTNVSWIKNVEKLAPDKVLIHLRAPFPAALEYLAMALPIYPHVYYAKVGPEGMAQHPVGSGPYEVVNLVQGKSVTLVKNESSFVGVPKIGKVVITFPPEKTTQMAELLSGQLDWMWYVPTDQVKNLEHVKGITVTSGETMRSGYIYFDAAGRSGKSPLQNEKVRQAIAYAINRPEFVKTFFAPGAEVLKAPCFPTQFGCYQDAKQYPYDLAKAKELMQEAGYPHGFKTTLYAWRHPVSWETALQGYMRQIGVDARIELLQYPAVRTKNQQGVTPMTFGDWGSYSINDASAIIGNFFQGSGDDFTGDKQLDKWVAEAGTSADPKVRKELYKKAIERIMDRMYMLPMNSYSIYYAYTDQMNFTPYRDELPRFYLYSWKEK